MLWYFLERSIREVYDMDGLSLHVTGFDRSVSSIANESVKAYQ